MDPVFGLLTARNVMLVQSYKRAFTILVDADIAEAGLVKKER